ncbi:hypothetical protein AGMMS49975_26320 [Clostridia bacterium]|nr:hypothetical protein AGMMS49975_26320 [Clostridia bacterium]
MDEQDTAITDAAAAETTAADTEKTFTQEQVNGIAAKEAKKAQEKLFKDLGFTDVKTASDGFKKYKEWAHTQKTELEKATDAAASTARERDELTQKFQAMSLENACLKNGVAPEAAEDAAHLAKRLISDEVDESAAILQILAKYPQFRAGERNKPTFSTNHATTQSTAQTDAKTEEVRKALGLI